MKLTSITARTSARQIWNSCQQEVHNALHRSKVLSDWSVNTYGLQDLSDRLVLPVSFVMCSDWSVSKLPFSTSGCVYFKLNTLV